MRANPLDQPAHASHRRGQDVAGSARAAALAWARPPRRARPAPAASAGAHARGRCPRRRPPTQPVIEAHDLIALLDARPAGGSCASDYTARGRPEPRTGVLGVDAALGARSPRPSDLVLCDWQPARRRSLRSARLRARFPSRDRRLHLDGGCSSRGAPGAAGIEQALDGACSDVADWCARRAHGHGSHARRAARAETAGEATPPALTAVLERAVALAEVPRLLWPSARIWISTWRGSSTYFSTYTAASAK